MDRAQKEKVVDELGQIFESSGVVVVAHYAGMTVAQMQDLRAKMRDVGGSVRVAKNTLAKIALEGKPAAKMGDLLTGMTVLCLFRKTLWLRPRSAKPMPRRTTSSSSSAGQWATRFWTRPVSKPWPPCRRVKSLSLRSCRASVRPRLAIAGAIGAPASNIASILSTIEEKAAA